MPTTLKTPFSIEGGRIRTTDDVVTQTEQKIMDVAVTRTYERVGHPEYGGNLQGLVFSSLDSLEFADFKTDLALEISRYVTGVTIQDIGVATTEGAEEGVADITIFYRLPLSSPTQFTFRVAIPGNLTEETPLT